MHKGQARFQDDRHKYFAAWCGQCWFKSYVDFDRSFPDEEIEKILRAEHAQHNRLVGKPLCGADPKIKRLEKNPWK